MWQCDAGEMEGSYIAKGIVGHIEFAFTWEHLKEPGITNREINDQEYFFERPLLMESRESMERSKVWSIGAVPTILYQGIGNIAGSFENGEV